MENGQYIEKQSPEKTQDYCIGSQIATHSRPVLWRFVIRASRLVRLTGFFVVNHQASVWINPHCGLTIA